MTAPIPAAPRADTPASPPDFAPLHAAMQRHVDGDLLAGVSSAVLVGREVVDLHCAGWADREERQPLRPDHLFRAFSNTKLLTSIAILQLVESGRLGLDDPVGEYVPQLANRPVLKPGATSLDDTEPARTTMTIRHLLSHSAGLSYGLLDPGTLIFGAYRSANVLNPATPLSEMMDRLGELPLVFHPGQSWAYSVATDVLSRITEVVTGQRFDAVLQSGILDPLDMRDTGFVVPPAEQHRLVTYYRGADPVRLMKPGLTRIDHMPYPNAYRVPVPRLSGGGGLVSSLPDMVKLITAMMPGGPTILSGATLDAMMTNQLPDGVSIGFAQGPVRGKGFGLGGCVTLEASSIDPPGSVGEFQWGGIAGTHWWISPRHGIAGVVMAQREMAFWHPFAFDMKEQVYRALGAWEAR